MKNVCQYTILTGMPQFCRNISVATKSCISSLHMPGLMTTAPPPHSFHTSKAMSHFAAVFGRSQSHCRRFPMLWLSWLNVYSLIVYHPAVIQTVLQHKFSLPIRSNNMSPVPMAIWRHAAGRWKLNTNAEYKYINRWASLSLVTIHHRRLVKPHWLLAVSKEKAFVKWKDSIKWQSIILQISKHLLKTFDNYQWRWLYTPPTHIKDTEHQPGPSTKRSWATSFTTTYRKLWKSLLHKLCQRKSNLAICIHISTPSYFSSWDIERYSIF